MPCKDHQFMVS